MDKKNQDWIIGNGLNENLLPYFSTDELAKMTSKVSKNWKEQSENIILKREFLESELNDFYEKYSEGIEISNPEISKKLKSFYQNLKKMRTLMDSKEIHGKNTNSKIKTIKMELNTQIDTLLGKYLESKGIDRKIFKLGKKYFIKKGEKRPFDEISEKLNLYRNIEEVVKKGQEKYDSIVKKIQLIVEYTIRGVCGATLITLGILCGIVGYLFCVFSIGASMAIFQIAVGIMLVLFIVGLFLDILGIACFVPSGNF
jgi:hypothetical protein